MAPSSVIQISCPAATASVRAPRLEILRHEEGLRSDAPFSDQTSSPRRGSPRRGALRALALLDSSSLGGTTAFEEMNSTDLAGREELAQGSGSTAGRLGGALLDAERISTR